MDTMDITLKLKQILNENKINNIKEKRWIGRFRESGSNQYSFVISFPKFFYSENNAYLVKTQEEVNLVMTELTSCFEEYVIEEAYATRTDYPFTFIMPEERIFSSYFELFKLIALIKNEDFKNSNSKYYSNLANGEKESFMFTNTKNTNNYTKKVLIYNQALKLKETKISTYSETLDKFTDLERRMRIEVSLKKKQDILNNGNLETELKKVKKECLLYLFNNTFNKNRITKGIENQIFNLTTYLQNKYFKKINWTEVMVEKLNDSKTVFSQEIFTGAIKELKKSERGKENARKVIREIARNTEIFYMNIEKDLEDIIVSIGEEAKE